MAQEETQVTVQEARERKVCRICGQPVSNPKAQPKDWQTEFGERLFPYPALTLNFGDEFAHTACIEAQEKK
jgi:hypothetical protein